MPDTSASENDVKLHYHVQFTVLVGLIAKARESGVQ